MDIRSILDKQQQYMWGQTGLYQDTTRSGKRAFLMN